MSNFQALTQAVLGRVKCPKGHFLIAVPSSVRPTFFCDLCYNNETDNAAPVFTCPRCDYDLCRKCAPWVASEETRLGHVDPRSSVVREAGRANCSGYPMHRGSNVPMLYCDGREPPGARMKCFCGTCDGQCGPRDGCACTSCLCAFEILALHNEPKCRCGNPLLCVPFCALGEDGAVCTRCHRSVTTTIMNKFAIGLGCAACGYRTSFVCPACAVPAGAGPAAAAFVRGAKYCICGHCSDVAPELRGKALPQVLFTVTSACWNRFAAEALLAGLRCRRGHLLTFRNDKGYRCDGCSVRVWATEGPSTGALSLRCETCDYDLCAPCVLARIQRQPGAAAAADAAPAPLLLRLDSAALRTLPQVRAYVDAGTNAAGVRAVFHPGAPCNMLACGTTLERDTCYCRQCPPAARQRCTSAHCPCPACFMSSVALALCVAGRCAHGCDYAVQTTRSLRDAQNYECSVCHARVSRATAVPPAALLLRSFECDQCLVCPRCTLARITEAFTPAPPAPMPTPMPTPEPAEVVPKDALCVCGACPAPARRYTRGMDRGAPFVVTRACLRRFMLLVLAARPRCNCGRDLHILDESSTKPFICDRCREHVNVLRVGVPRLQCLHCYYDLCAACALEHVQAARAGAEAEVARRGNALLTQMCNMDGTVCHFGTDVTLVAYCGCEFGGKLKCLCGGCDGRCGPTNGCACAACTNAVRAALLSLRPRCRAVGHLLSVVTVGDLPAEHVCAWCHSRVVRDRVRYAQSTLALACDCCGPDSVVCHVCTHELLVDAIRRARERPTQGTPASTGSGTGTDEKLCTACCRLPASCAFLPCGHVCMCLDCANEWLERSKTCPMCRAPSQQVVRLHFS